MRCFGRTTNLKRCANSCRFVTCKTHRIQAFVFVILTVPTLALTYRSVYTDFIRPALLQKEIPELVLQVGEDPSIGEIQKYFYTSASQRKPTNSNESAIPVLKEIITLYEGNEIEKSKKLIEKHFAKKLKDYDEFLGYVVTCYFYTESYIKAAETVLIRNKTHKSWDYSLKLDLAKCIRYYTFSTTLNEGINLVDSLKFKFRDPLISYLWTSIPYEIMVQIEDGIHYISNIEYCITPELKNNLTYLIKRYPRDPFIYYGYYIFGDYLKSLSVKNNRIRDLSLFGHGYSVVKIIAD